MKSSASVLLLATGAMARVHLLVRDLSQLDGILNQVLSGLNDTDNAVVSYTGGETLLVGAALDKMASLARDSTQQVATEVNILSLEEAYDFQTLSKHMNEAGNQLVADVKNKIPLFGMAEACGDLEAKFSAMANAASGLMTTVAARFPTNAGTGEISRFADVFTETTEMLASCAGSEGGCAYPHPPSPPSSYQMGPPSSYPTGAPIPSYSAAPPAQPTGYPTAAPPSPPSTQPAYGTWSSSSSSSSSSGGYWTQPPVSAYPTPSQPPSWGNGSHGGSGGGNNGPHGGNGGNGGNGGKGGDNHATPTEPASPPVFSGAATSLGMSGAALIAIIGAFIL